MRFMLGTKIERDRFKHSISISQSDYVKNILKSSHGYHSYQQACKHTFVQGKGSDQVRSTADRQPASGIPTGGHQAVPSCPWILDVRYVEHQTRYLLCGGRLAQFASTPREQHWCALKQVIRCLAGTLRYSITYSRNGHESEHPTLIGFRTMQTILKIGVQ